jgi:hypothetical protein
VVDSEAVGRLVLNSEASQCASCVGEREKSRSVCSFPSRLPRSKWVDEGWRLDLILYRCFHGLVEF